MYSKKTLNFNQKQFQYTFKDRIKVQNSQTNV